MEEGNEEIKRKRPRKQAEEKIVREEESAEDAPLETPKKTEEPKVNKRLHRVLIKGKERQLTESAIRAASKDKKLNLQIPEDSTFSMPNFKKCKDC